MPVSSYSKIDIINQALNFLGEAPIDSVESGGDVGLSAEITYDITLTTLLAGTKWRFATKQASLPQVTGLSTKRYPYAFALPNDLLYLQQTQDRSYRYEIYGNELYTNEHEVTIDYTVQPDESTFPAYFVSAFKYELAKQICLTLSRSNTLLQLSMQAAAMSLKEAQYLDSSQRPSTKFLRQSRYTGVRI